MNQIASLFLPQPRKRIKKKLQIKLMDTGFPPLQTQQYQNVRPVELVLTNDQMKAIQSFLPRGYSLVTLNKNTRKNSKNQKSKNQNQYSNFKQENRRKKILSNLDFTEGEFNNKKCQQILKLVKQHRFSSPFLYPVDPIQLQIPEYFGIIKNPMDLQTIEEKLKNDDYNNDKEFEDDVNLVWDNALLFNYEGNEIHTMALEMKNEFQRILQLSNEQLFAKRPNQKNSDNGRTKSKGFNDKPLTQIEKEQLFQDIRQLNDVQIQEIFNKIKNYTEISSQNIEVSLEKIPPKVSREIQKFVNSKLPLVQMTKKIKEKTVKTIPKDKEIPKPKPPVSNNPYVYQENTVQTTDVPIVNQEPKQEVKQLNMDSSDSSLISDLESD